MSRHSSSGSRLTVIIPTALALLVFAGCGRENVEPMGTLSGSVMSGDEIIGDCKVGIFNSATLRSISATVNEQGAYRIKEIPFGEYTVWVSPKPVFSNEPIVDPRLPKKYLNKETSGIVVAIPTVDEVKLDIDLK